MNDADVTDIENMYSGKAHEIPLDKSLIIFNDNTGSKLKLGYTLKNKK